MGLFASGLVAAGDVHGGGNALVQGRGSAKGGDVCLRAIMHGAVFCVWVWGLAGEVGVAVVRVVSEIP